MFTQRQIRLANLRKSRMASLRSKKASPIISHDSLDQLEDNVSAIIDTMNQLWKFVGNAKQAVYKVDKQTQDPADAHILQGIQNDLSDISHHLQIMLKKAEAMSENVSDEVNYLRGI